MRSIPFLSQAFPTDGESWALISTGRASSIAGTATTFYSYNTGGPISTPFSHRGYPSFDIATLRLELLVPFEATTLSFDWKFGTEENPSWLGLYVDWASAIITTSTGSTNTLLLPDGNPVDIDKAAPFSNAVGCFSESPCPPFPELNDVVYNAVTKEIYTATFDVSPFVGETITIEFYVADENDQILDSALFIDNLNIEVGRIFPDKAVKLAKKVIEAPYLEDGRIYGGKGLQCNWGRFKFVSPEEITKEGYYFYDRRIDACSIEKGRGLDCSGLIYWSYNRAYFGGRVLTREEFENRPLRYDGAHWQFHGNSKPISKEELRPGDLLFFDTDKNNWIDHVAMYRGGNDVCNVIHASGFTDAITCATYKAGKLTTIRLGVPPQILTVDAYRRVVDAIVELRIIATGSPVDLILTDPEGFVTSIENPWEGPMEYQVYDIDGDGSLDDILITGKRKIGNYLIQVVPERNVLPTDTYTLKIEALVNGEMITVVLAENVPIKEIPVPYILHSTETEITSTIIPVIVPPYVDLTIPETLTLLRVFSEINAELSNPLANFTTIPEEENLDIEDDTLTYTGRAIADEELNLKELQNRILSKVDQATWESGDVVLDTDSLDITFEKYYPEVVIKGETFIPYASVTISITVYPAYTELNFDIDITLEETDKE